ncbi:MAG: hypothetical protein JWM58_4039 [Rhizobium sp.]|nr:hypothetical protein [Rhizobium sp.]
MFGPGRFLRGSESRSTRETFAARGSPTSTLDEVNGRRALAFGRGGLSSLPSIPMLVSEALKSASSALETLRPALKPVRAERSTASLKTYTSV